MRAASSVTADMHKHPRCVSLFQLASVLLLASKLGRRACGMPADETPVEPSAPPALYPSFEEALAGMYSPEDNREL